MIRMGYILAASHSGSTLLAMLLGAHPQVCTVGELKLTSDSFGVVERYRCSCGCSLRTCPFWNRVRAAMAERGEAFDVGDAGTDHRAAATPYARWLLGPLHRGRLLERLRDSGLSVSGAWRKHLSQTNRRNVVLAETILALTGSEVIIDSSKSALRLKYLLRNPELDIRVVRLLRDGRGVALTYMDPAAFADASDPSLRGGGMGGTRESECLSIEEAAYDWRRSNEEAEQAVGRMEKSRWVAVRYEDLCADVENALKRVFDLLGVSPEKTVRDFRSVEHHVIGNGMRLDLTSQIQLDDRWRKVLTQEQLGVFDSIAGRLNRKYGYT